MRTLTLMASPRHGRTRGPSSDGSGAAAQPARSQPRRPDPFPDPTTTATGSTVALDPRPASIRRVMTTIAHELPHRHAVLPPPRVRPRPLVEAKGDARRVGVPAGPQRGGDGRSDRRDASATSWCDAGPLVDEIVVIDDHSHRPHRAGRPRRPAPASSTPAEHPRRARRRATARARCCGSRCTRREGDLDRVVRRRHRATSARASSTGHARPAADRARRRLREGLLRAPARPGRRGRRSRHRARRPTAAVAAASPSWPRSVQPLSGEYGGRRDGARAAAVRRGLRRRRRPAHRLSPTRSASTAIVAGRPRRAATTATVRSTSSRPRPWPSRRRSCAEPTPTSRPAGRAGPPDGDRRRRRRRRAAADDRGRREYLARRRPARCLTAPERQRLGGRPTPFGASDAVVLEAGERVAHRAVRAEALDRATRVGTLRPARRRRLADHRDDRHVERGGQLDHAADDLAVERLRVEEPLAGDDQVGLLDRLVEIRPRRRPGRSPTRASAPTHGEPAGQSAGAPAPSSVGHVDAVLVVVHLRPGARGGARAARPGPASRPSAGRTRAAASTKRGAHVARHHELDAAQPVHRVQRAQRAEPAVGGGRSADADDDLASHRPRRAAAISSPVP